MVRTDAAHGVARGDSAMKGLQFRSAIEEPGAVVVELHEHVEVKIQRAQASRQKERRPRYRGFEDRELRQQTVARLRDQVGVRSTVLEKPIGVNRPGFPRGFFFQNLRGFFKGVHLCVERLLDFLRRSMGNGAV
jgi:hypothetical protein